VKLFAKERVGQLFFAILLLIALILVINYSVSLAAAVFAWSFLLLPFGLLLCTTGQFSRSIAFASAVVVSVILLDRLKVHYYKDHLFFPDLWLMMDSSNWETMLHYSEVGLAFILLLVLLVYSALLHRKKDKRYGYLVRSGGIVIIILCVGLSNYFFRDEATIQAWVKTLPGRGNAFLNLIMSSKGFVFQPPEIIADDSLFKQALTAQLYNAHSKDIDEKLPDIIVWLQESTVNLRIFDVPCAQWPELTMFEPQTDKVAMSWLRVHTNGGKTWQSEFAFLSGLSSTDFGSSAAAVYYTVTPHLSYSLPKFLKEKGYFTMVLSPFNKNAYNAGNAYRDFGFDLVLQPQDLGFPAKKSKNLWKISSAEMAEYAKKALALHSDKPVFMFMLTMREHGSYDSDTTPSYGLNQCIDANTAGLLTDYIERLEALDKATEDFNRHLADRKLPYIFAYFGDHQPNFGHSTFGYSIPFVRPDFVTQFVVRSSLPNKNIQYIELMDLSFLPGLLIEQAELVPNDFFTANITMRKQCAGKLEDCTDKELLESYRAYLYNTLRVAEK